MAHHLSVDSPHRLAREQGQADESHAPAQSRQHFSKKEGNSMNIKRFVGPLLVYGLSGWR